jgi:hypothetical protein
MDAAVLHPDSQTGRAFVREIPGFVDAHEAASVYAILQSVSVPSSLFYVGVAALAAPHTAAALAAYLPPALADFIVSYLRRLLRAAPDAMRTNAHGFEIWTTRPKRSDDGQIYLHIDCDEKLRTGAGVVRTPMLGSVLYLGPDAGLVGGETLFVNDERLCERFTPYRFHDWATLKGESEAVHVVEHRPGKLALFAGHMAHGQGPVLDHPEGQPRVAFLANLWDAPIGDVPHGLCKLSPEEYRRKMEG